MVIFRALRSGISISRQQGQNPIISSSFTSTLRYSSTMVRPAGMLSNRYTVDDMPDMSGKVAIVTGGSRGIGLAAVTALVQKGCEGRSSLLFEC
jgi:hypothetical protein